MENTKLNNALMVNEVAASEDNNHEETTVTEVKPSLFAGESTQGFTSNNQMSKTAQLTQIASRIADEVFAEAYENLEDFEGKLLASQKSHDAMDDLIAELSNLGEVDLSFLKTESEDDLEKMIRSQQSKRSRAKSKTMTQENYLIMMTGAVAELLLRLAANKPKSSGGGAVMGEIGFSAEDIEMFAEFPDELKKAIRNVQSKKSIMKSKADFDVQSPRWQQLLRAEQQLKEVRDRAVGNLNKRAQEALEAKEKASAILGDVNVKDLPPEEAVKLLDQVREMLASK